MALNVVQATQMAHYSFGDFLLCPEQRRLCRGNQPVAITPRALDLLIVLVQSAGHMLERAELLRAVWGSTTVADSNLTVNLYTLRRALGNCQHYVTTVPGRGYQFTAPVKLEPIAISTPAEGTLRVTVELLRPDASVAWTGSRQWAANTDVPVPERVATWLESALAAPRE